MSEQHKIALITGANKGIGYETARQLGHQGVTVLVGARDKAKGEAAVEELRTQGVTAEAVVLDVTDDQSVSQAAELVRTRYGRLDILINNAGIANDTSHQPSDMPIREYKTVFDTNLYGPIRVMEAFLPMLNQAPSGRIVNVSSTLGSLTKNDGSATGSMAPYNASKSALNRVMLDYAAELKDTPIKINNVCPGYVATDINDHSGPRSTEQGARIAVDMALIGAEGPSGSFRDENGVIPW